MKISDIMKDRLAISLEVFPPKQDKPVEPLNDVISRFMRFAPDMISCTYGAGGTNKGRQSDILRHICNQGTIAQANYTCIASRKDETLALVEEYRGFGVGTFLALRGDYPKGTHSTNGDFAHANELAAFLRENVPALELGCGCYPEKHLESVDMEEEYRVMRLKQDAGINYFISQLCYDLDNFFRFRDGARKNGITLPIMHGLMPVLSIEGSLKMALSNGCSIPKGLAELHGKYGDSPEDFKKAGKEYTLAAISRLLREGVDGLQIFTLNKYDDAAEIIERAGLRCAK